MAQRVGATIVTLRSALRLLGNDGLIENVPKWGVRIPEETCKSISERYYVRELLEVGAAEKLRAHHTEEMIAELSAMAKECDQMMPDAPDAWRGFAEKHFHLHLRIAELTGNGLLAETLSRLNFRSMMLSGSVVHSLLQMIRRIIHSSFSSLMTMMVLFI